MINKKAISLNIFFSLVQILFTGVVYYFLYKFLLQAIGTDLMGVWAIVLAISSAANIANLGIGASVVRFTAKFKVNDETGKINSLVHTSFLFLGGLFLLIISIVYFVAPWWLHAVIKDRYFSEAMSLVPYSLLCLFLNALSSIFTSCIDGLQKNYLRSLIYILSFAVLIIATRLLVPVHGLMGMAYAQLLQALFLLVGSVVSLKLLFAPLRFFPVLWDKDVFKGIFSFGVQEQIISICQLCFDPLTKSILGSFGNLGMVTYYEMANRLITQLRAFLVSANQVFIPAFTSTNEKSAESAANLYRKVFSISFLLSILWLSLIVSAIIPVSKIWIGGYNAEFVVMALLLAFAYWCNIVISPAYFANMGSATLRDNVVSNMIIAVLNVVLCSGLGYFFSGYGVVAGWSAALATGSLYVMFRYHQRQGLQLGQLVLRKDIGIILLGFLTGISSFLFFYLNITMNVWAMFGIVLFVLSLVLAAVYYTHPVSKTLTGVLKTKM